MLTKAFTSLILVHAASIYGYTLQNVTIAATDPSLTYLPPVCQSKPGFQCSGGWATDTSNPNDYNGTDVRASDPADNLPEPYVTYSFTGSAVYVYQWLDTDTAAQLVSWENFSRMLNFTQDASQYTSTPVSDTPQLILAWSWTGLNPTQTHAFAIQHQRSPGRNTYVTLDHLVVTMTIGEIPRPKGLSVGAKTGIAIGVIVFVIVAFFASVAIRNTLRRRKAATERRNVFATGSAKTGPATTSNAPNITLKWMAPSSELEASERLAREGIREEELEKA